jgi:hypothetical protein
MAKKTNQKQKSKKKRGQLMAFRLEDDAVAQALYEAENESRFINEAIRLRGPAAALALLERDAMEAEHKYRTATKAQREK